MWAEQFSKSFIEMMPLPVIVVKELEDDLNHPIAYLNKRFVEVLGWNISDIPDKNTWWQTGYPDENYQKVVCRQWELSVEIANENGDDFVMMEVNVATKYDGDKRFRVYAERSSSLLDGFYLVVFEPIPPSIT